MSNPAQFQTPDESTVPTAETPIRTADGTGEDTHATQSLYRKFRPQSFAESELVGQEAIVRTLKSAILQDRLAHAFLFSGPRGTGKTTTARLLAKAVNCTEPDRSLRPCNRCAACQSISKGTAIDVIEIDAASNRGIDDIRELRERVKFAPAQLRTKFYIIDEAHQITGAAANAFLKTLEEPPPHTRFVLATTDPEQILPTIVSRCQKFEFRRIPVDAMTRRVADVAALEGVGISAEALAVIARQSSGSLRDALGLLDQVAAYRRGGRDEAGEITAADVRDLLGLSRDELVVQIVTAIARRDAAEALTLLQQATDRGVDPRQLGRQIVQFLRSVMHELASPGSNADPDVQRASTMFTLAEAMAEAERFSELDFKLRHNAIPQLPLEIGLVASVLRDVQPATVSLQSVAPAESPTAPVPAQTPTANPSAPKRSVQPTVERAPEEPRPLRSLSDRIREPAQPDRSKSPTPGKSSEVAPAICGPVTVEKIRNLWEQIRADVKVISRRVEALLLSVDPAMVQGSTVILASAYPFHRNKLNEDDVKLVIEGVISKLVGAPVRVNTVLHGEVPAARAGSTGAASGPLAAASPLSALPEQAPPRAELTDEEQRTLDAVKNLFDAEEIAP